MIEQLNSILTKISIPHLNILFLLGLANNVIANDKASRNRDDKLKEADVKIREEIQKGLNAQREQNYKLALMMKEVQSDLKHIMRKVQ